MKSKRVIDTQLRIKCYRCVASSCHNERLDLYAYVHISAKWLYGVVIADIYPSLDTEKRTLYGLSAEGSPQKSHRTIQINHWDRISVCRVKSSLEGKNITRKYDQFFSQHSWRKEFLPQAVVECLSLSLSPSLSLTHTNKHIQTARKRASWWYYPNHMTSAAICWYQAVISINPDTAGHAECRLMLST